MSWSNYEDKVIGNLWYESDGDIYTHEFVHDGYGGYDENIYENDRDPQCKNLYHLGAKWVTDDPQELREYIKDCYDINNANDKLKKFLKGD